jgi:6-phosphogluconolactonase (cycloisomerase 2 family)
MVHLHGKSHGRIHRAHASHLQLRDNRGGDVIDLVACAMEFEIGYGAWRAASAFSVNPQTGALRFLNTVGAGGQPAHVAVHPGGKYLLTANYTGSTVAVFPIQGDGSLGTAPQIIPHFGALGPNAGRQEAPHPHMVLPDSTGKYVLVNDLGLDATIVYSFDTDAGKMSEVTLPEQFETELNLPAHGLRSG